MLMLSILFTSSIFAQNENFFSWSFWESATIEDVEKEIKNGASITARDEYGSTPLIKASSASSNTEVIEFLLSLGADVNARSDVVEKLATSGWTPLLSAVSFNENPEVIQILLEHGADVNAFDSVGRTALMTLYHRRDNTSFVESFIQHGADVHARDYDGWTALMHASSSTSNVEDIKLLIKHGSDINAQNNSGETAYMIALRRWKANPEIVDLLRNYGDNGNKHFL